jgi:hypothetical protein
MKCPVDSRPCHCEEECNLVKDARQYCSGYDLDPEETAKRDEQGAELGDARRCVVHPNQTTSSPDGMFDNPCPLCEHEENEADERDRKAAELYAETRALNGD